MNEIRTTHGIENIKFQGLYLEAAEFFITVYNSTTLLLFHHTQTSTDPILRDVYSRLIVPSRTLPLTNEEGLSTVCQKSNYAFLTLSMIEKLIRPHLSCSLVEVPDYYIPVSMGMVGRKQSKFKTIFNYQ
jgi:hypothetical protein